MTRRERRRVEDARYQEWKGGYRHYDLVKEASIALGVILALCVVLTILFSSPDEKPSTIKQWSRADPVDFVTTATTELDGTSGTGGYGPPYNHASDGQNMWFIHLQKWFGVSHPVNTAQDFVLAPLRSIGGQPALQAPEPPPPLPEYSQPDCPGDGYLWTPGYWSYSPQGYYWVPGAWARPPEVGLLWTPGYWGSSGGRYRYHYGFWGRHIGYYGGINYGFGYVGAGYQGGYWNGDRFNYNRSVNNVNVSNVQVYNRTVTNTVIINNTTVNVTNNRSSYNGPGGVTRQPLPTEIAATREQRIPPMNTQLQQQQAAAQNHQQFASVNHGRPAVVASAKPIAAGKPIAPVIPARAAVRPSPPRRPG